VVEVEVEVYLQMVEQEVVLVGLDYLIQLLCQLL
jgi:hypothetical protein